MGINGDSKKGQKIDKNGEKWAIMVKIDLNKGQKCRKF